MKYRLIVKKNILFSSYFIVYIIKMIIEAGLLLIHKQARKDLVLLPLKIFGFFTSNYIAKSDFNSSSHISTFNSKIVKEAFYEVHLNFFKIATKNNGWPYTKRVGVNRTHVPQLVDALKLIALDSPEFKIIFNPYLIKIPIKIKDIPRGLLKLLILRSKMISIYAELNNFSTKLMPGAFAFEVDLWSYNNAELFVTQTPNDITQGFPIDYSYEDIEKYFENNKTIHDLEFPVDMVYTWVDGEDALWLKRKNEYQCEYNDLHCNSASQARFSSHDELKYSLRSICYYANFFNHVYLVTNGQVPEWLNEDSSRITVINHRDIFKDIDNLPTFNSHAIESCLHRIPGLSEHFIYMNDDFFIARPLAKRYFFTAIGQAKSFFNQKNNIDHMLCTVLDSPFVSASKNNRELIKNKFDRLTSYTMMHSPMCQIKSGLEELEKIFSYEFMLTESHRFRTLSDISIPSSLSHHYGLIKGYHIEAKCKISTIRICDLTFFVDALVRLFFEKDKDFFCLNERDFLIEQRDERDAVLQWFLSAYFPYKSEFEK